MRARLDPFILSLVATALLGSFLPAEGVVFDVFRIASVVAIGLLFFLYGTRLSTSQTLAGLGHWRLHLVVLASTFVVYPLAGLAVQLIPDAVLRPSLAQGVLLLTLVPSTVQSCVVYTRQAGGNTAAAVVSASLSSLLGVVLTPALVALLMSAQAEVTLGSVLRIVLQILVPFVLGQLVRPFVGGWVERHDRPLKLVDRGSILLVVYVAFSEGASYGIWSAVSVRDVVVVVVLAAALLVGGYLWSLGGARLIGLPRADRIAVLFCGSNKSLASGLPIATVLFTGPQVAVLVLPLMFFHQLQIIAGALLAPRLARTTTHPAGGPQARSAGGAAT